jgi:hypothetical protein
MQTLEKDKKSVMREINVEVNFIADYLLGKEPYDKLGRLELTKMIKTKAFIKKHMELAGDLLSLVENKKVLEEQIKNEEIK